MEHVVALASGGGNVKENVVAACKPCNRKKGYDYTLARSFGNGRRPKPAVAMTTINLRLSQDEVQVADEVQRLAVDDDRSVNAEIVRALREFVERRQQQTARQAS